MKYKKQLFLGVGIILVMLMMNFVVAEEVAEKPTIWETIRSYFIDPFTIVGQDVGASVYPDESWDVQPGETFDKSASSYCSSGQGLFNVAVWNGVYVPKWENKDRTVFTCGSQNQKCIVDLYCINPPNSFCSSDSDCGSGYECETKSAVDPYMPLKDIYGNTITSYSFCTPTEACTGSDITCWQISGNVCQSRTYDCNYQTYPNCPTTWAYTSLSECEGEITPTNGVPSGDADFQVDIISATPIVFSSEQDVNINVEIENRGGKGSMKVEVGLYKDEDITSWGFGIVQDAINCEPNEKNVDTKLIELGAGEEITETFTIITPKICRKLIEPIGTFDLLAVSFVNCMNTGLATGVTSSDRFNIAFTPRIDCTGSCTNGIRDGEETDTDCGGSECEKCRNGWKCERITDCQSGLQCLEGYCSPSDTSRGNQKGISASKIKQMTAEDLAASACTKSTQCEEESECQSLQYLVNEGHLTDEEAESIIDRSAIFFTSAGAIGGVAACAGLSLVLAPAAPILFPLCALAGGALGLGINDIFESFGDKDLSKAGYCIKEGKGLEIFKWAAWFDITGDGVKDGTDGLIIIIIGAALLILFIKR